MDVGIVQASMAYLKYELRIDLSLGFYNRNWEFRSFVILYRNVDKLFVKGYIYLNLKIF